MEEYNEYLEKTNKIMIYLTLGMAFLSFLICISFGYYLKNNEETKILIQEQNKELRIENEKIVEEFNNLIKEVEILENTLTYNREQDMFLKALVNTTFNYETGYGKSDLWNINKNAGGIKGYYSGEYLTYESAVHGLTHLESLLEDNYINVYGRDINAIRKAYDPNYTEEQLNEFLDMFNKEYIRLMEGGE